MVAMVVGGIWSVVAGYIAGLVGSFNNTVGGFPWLGPLLLALMCIWLYYSAKQEEGHQFPF
jgi:uncharacterized oligopeptide transporter (OPT) family protein